MQQADRNAPSRLVCSCIKDTADQQPVKQPAAHLVQVCQARVVRHALEGHMFTSARCSELHARAGHQIVGAPMAPVDAVLQPAREACSQPEVWIPQWYVAAARELAACPARCN